VSYQKTEKKNTNTHYHCPISVYKLTTSKSEAVLEIHRCGLKLMKKVMGDGRGRGRGGNPSFTSFYLSGKQVSGLLQTMRSG
jgi:hypothetical protein